MSHSVEGFPLSPQQKDLWHHEHFDHSSSFRSSVLCAIEGALDLDKLRAATRSVAELHEILRTRFVKPAGVKLPLQVIADALDPEIETRAVATDDDVHAAMHELGRRVFDYEKGPLLHVTVFTTKAGRQYVGLVAPSLVADARSLGNLLGEIGAAYEGTELDEPLQYADFSAWQEEQLTTTDGDAGKAHEHWKRVDVAAATAMQMPHEKRRAPGGKFEPASVRVPVDGATLDAIVAAGAKHDAKPEAALLAAFQALLWRITGQSEIVVGLVSHERSQDEMRGALGAYAKTLPVTSRLEGTISFAELVAESRRSLAEALRHQDQLPFDENAAIAGHPGLPVVLDVIERSAKKLGGAKLVPVHEASHASRFAVKLAVARGEGGSAATLHYDRALLDHATAARIAGHFATLAKGIASAPDTALSRLALVDAGERRFLIEELNATKGTYAVDRTIHKMIEDQADKAPNAPAVIAGGATTTFAELDARANQLAHLLAETGVTPGALVGLCVDRDADFVVGVLGILKKGASWVPLDPEYPKDRRAFQLQDARVPVLLTQTKLLADMPEHAAKVVTFDGDKAKIDAKPRTRLEARGAVGDVAYVIHTSGTTGNPRGVQITHGNLCHYVQALGPRLGVTSSDRYLHTASIAFSSSVRQLVMPLALGAAVVIASVEDRRDPVQMFKTMKATGVTVIDLVPSHWRTCIQVLEAQKESERAALLDNKLRLIVSASEALWSDIPHAWRKSLKHPAKLINMFGQTETTGIVSTYPIPDDEPDAMHVVPLGRPIPNSRIYILDQHLEPVPEGVIGELFVGGLGVGKGYLNQPERTAEKFIADPFLPGERLYRTGDRARYLPGSNIEFLGRSDNQVKIRGFRIELGEIEANLGAHPQVREAVVVAREDEPGEKKLVAYLLIKGDKHNANVTDIRLRLAEKVPSYMMPSSFVLLDHFPMTPNGKVDRKALPAPDQAADLEKSYVAPSNIVEDALSGIWAELLNVPRIGVQDDFFEVGGHSLLLTQLMSRVQDTFKIALGVRAFYDAKTVAEQASLLVKNEAKPGMTEKIAKVVKKIQGMSADEAKQALAAKK